MKKQHYFASRPGYDKAMDLPENQASWSMKADHWKADAERAGDQIARRMKAIHSAKLFWPRINDESPIIDGPFVSCNVRSRRVLVCAQRYVPHGSVELSLEEATNYLGSLIAGCLRPPSALNTSPSYALRNDPESLQEHQRAIQRGQEQIERLLKIVNHSKTLLEESGS